MAEETLEQPQAPATGRSRTVMIVTVALLVIGGAGAAWFFLLGASEQESAEQNTGDTRPGASPVEYVELSPSFVVSFPHRGRQRFMQAELSVMSRDPEASEAVRRHMPLIRHNLNTLFSAQLLLVFEDPAGVENLRRLATEEVQAVLQNEIGRPGIEQVLFTTFVMQ